MPAREPLKFPDHERPSSMFDNFRKQWQAALQSEDTGLARRLRQLLEQGGPHRELEAGSPSAPPPRAVAAEQGGPHRELEAGLDWLFGFLLLRAGTKRRKPLGLGKLDRHYIKSLREGSREARRRRAIRANAVVQRRLKQDASMLRNEDLLFGRGDGDTVCDYTPELEAEVEGDPEGDSKEGVMARMFDDLANEYAAQGARLRRGRGPGRPKGSASGSHLTIAHGCFKAADPKMTMEEFSDIVRAGQHAMGESPDKFLSPEAVKKLVGRRRDKN